MNALRTSRRLVLRAGAAALLLPAGVWAGGTVTNCTEADFLAAAAGGGRVTFACDGIITLSQTFSNNVDIVLDATGHNVSLSGGGVRRVFYVATNVNFKVLNLAIAQGSAGAGGGILSLGGKLILCGATLSGNIASYTNSDQAPFCSGTGGGICVAGGTLNATNSTFFANLAWIACASGGAIENNGGTVNLKNCVFTSNGASGLMSAPPPGPGFNVAGGAIDTSGTLVADSCIFVANTARAGGSGNAWGGSASGGAINNRGLLLLNYSSFYNNGIVAGAGGVGSDAGYGGYPPAGSGGTGGDANGAAIFNSGSAYVADCTFSSNSATAAIGGTGGRGVAIFDVGSSGGPGGTGGTAGGGIFSSGTLSLVNCTVSANSSSGGAGGFGGAGSYGLKAGGNGGAGGKGGNAEGAIASTNGITGLTNCTIALNFALAGGGGGGGSGGSSPGYPGHQGAPGTNGVAYGGLFAPGATLLNCLLATNAFGNSAGQLIDSGHNLSSDASCAFSNIGSLNNTEPLLAPLADNGGPTLTMALCPGSPAIDAADTAFAPRSDQRGYLRSAGAAADIGAFEFGAVPPVLLSIRLTGPTTLELCGQWAFGTSQSCRLQASPDMLSWTPIATNQFDTNGTVIFERNRDPVARAAFYRLSMP